MSMANDPVVGNGSPANPRKGHNRFLLLVAGLGGLLYGIDVGIIAGALPYLEATSGLNANQLSIIVAAVLLGSVIGGIFAGMLADWMGRKLLMTFSGLLFVLSIPLIALAHGFSPLALGRVLQGVSAGLIGVVVPLYLAECLAAASRGKGTGIFQWLLTLGIMMAAIIGIYFSIRVEAVAKSADAEKLFAFKDAAWRRIFWVSLPPGILFVIGSRMIEESPRWLFRRGRKEAARAALLRSRSEEQADLELSEMEAVAAAEKAKASAVGVLVKESLLHRKYVIPLLFACIIAACNQATGINSIIGYSTTILIQAGLNDVQAHWGYVILTIALFGGTAAGVMLVDRKGRKFLFSIGTAGVIVALTGIGLLFRQNEKLRVDCHETVQNMVTTNQTVSIVFDRKMAAQLLSGGGDASRQLAGGPATLIVIYSYGDFHAATPAARSNEHKAAPIEITRENCLPGNRVVAFFSNPFADLKAARTAPLKIERALITPRPGVRSGWWAAAYLLVFIAFFAVGPGICVWLALTELLPTRIRSNGMCIAILLNQVISTTIAAVFLPTVGRWGYSSVFFMFAACTVIYFVTTTFFLPETKGKTLEEIEEHFEGGSKAQAAS
jgi:MFS transporter, SP family, solute carrier family 2 (myo-inositol transporter), member 13